ncbi:hypothetical protein PR202_gb16132 [Eleusine coracana subsp. coracana]|uniref:Uncharacterized protein n=1 Tax=Eleusine coracana subsp. coracana TaxID=191504 RepID=A0AAV5F1D4_ELECO|nr:hypothetical protein PR202_gb16118 [Eleusine coracana subsp. coracana]GJN28051.1 hypothetical protein PR202_gb16132 [Eleusine coracana subsp. coracana]
MAEAIVGLLISKIGVALGNKAATYAMSQISNEASDLRSLFGEIHKPKEELESIKAYLRDIEKYKDISETTHIFIKNIRHLAFRIEDVIDEFTYKLEDDKYVGFASKTRKRVRNVHIWKRLALELRHINAEIEDATRRRDRYAMVGSWRNNDLIHQNRSANRIIYIPRKEDLVGIEDIVDKIKRWLVSDLDGRNTKTITVWGMGGVGKTTLVDYVYNIVNVNFDAAAWITVSKNHQVEDLLNKICKELAISVDTNMEMRNLVTFSRNHLEGKRYIIVLDDVWEVDVWINIMDVFPTNCISRFVITSRKYEVASLATGNCTVKLDPLALNHSYELFCKLAFRYCEDKSCPLELCELAAKFLLKCEGLPIAIACIGRLLSCKPPTYSIWDNV